MNLLIVLESGARLLAFGVRDAAEAHETLTASGHALATELAVSVEELPDRGIVVVTPSQRDAH